MPVRHRPAPTPSLSRSSKPEPSRGITPQLLGLPPRYDRFWEGQEKAIVDVALSDRRFSLLSAPTGAGKSLIYNAIPKLLASSRALILVGTKGLQHQLSADFAPIGMVDVRGRGNYACPEASTCDRPYEEGIECGMREECSYLRAVAEAAASPLVVSNYAYWMSLARYSDPFAIGSFDCLVLDEAHTAEGWVGGFVTVELDRGEVDTLLRMEVPAAGDGIEAWAGWAREASAAARLRKEAARRDDHELRRRLGRLETKLVDLREADRERGGEDGELVRWVGEEIETRSGAGAGVRIGPVWPRQFAERYLFRGVPRVVLASATITKDTAKYLGIKEEEFELYEVPSTFPVERRPVIWVTGGLRLTPDYRMTAGQMRLWVGRIDRVLEKRLDRKGVIHTRSYRRAQQIAAMSRYREHMILHDGRGLRDAVERFKRSAAPKILVSPAVEEGFDFGGDLCRYVVIAKIPFLDTRPPILKARNEEDRDWKYHEAARTVVQMAGRGMRSREDLCEVLVIDDAWGWFREKVSWPGWFRAAWQTARDRVPEPPRVDD